MMGTLLYQTNKEHATQLSLLHALLPLLIHHVPLGSAPRAREHPHRVVVPALGVLRTKNITIDECL
jgi:hypothetical protein